MIQIKAPDYYISEPGAVNRLKELVERVSGKTHFKALIIWSKTAKEKTVDSIERQFNDSGIEYSEVLFSGFPTEIKAGEYAAAAIGQNADVIIAAGGGKVMDVAKAASTISGIPVITVPTIAATCAAWAAVSILYLDSGDYDKAYWNPASPRAVIADTEIIASAPVRYLKAGIVDTLAKWYEPIYEGSNTFTTELSVFTAKQAYEYLKQNGADVVGNAENHIIDEKTVRVIDCIIYLAGVVGSFVGGQAFSGMAHPFYHSSRRIASTHHKLHGEIVAFGLVLQAVLENRSQDEIKEREEILSSFDNLYSLDEIGLNEESDIRIIAKRILEEFPNTEAFRASEDSITEAFYAADRIVKKYRSEKCQ